MLILIGNGFHFNKILGHVMTRTFPPGELMLSLPNLNPGASRCPYSTPESKNNVD
jgi:hypothetical protein